MSTADSVTLTSGSSYEYMKSSNWNSRKYLCSDCGRTFTLKASLMRHKEFECNERLLKNNVELGDDQDPKKKHVCNTCKRSYAFFTSLWRHQRYECGVEKKFACPVCRAKFAQKSNLDRHVRTRH